MTKDKSIVEKAKRELKSYINDKMWINEKWEDLAERRNLLDKITTTITDMPKSNSVIVDKKAEELSKILDDTQEFYNFLQQLTNKQIKIENKIDRLNQPYKNILYFRYIKGYNLTEVSNKIETEYDYTRKLHGIALIKYAELGD